MDRFRERLNLYPILGLDTSIFVYHLEENPIYLSIVQGLFSGIEAGEWEAVTSTITLMEINVRPFHLEQAEVARRYEALLFNFPHLKIVNIDRDVARKAASLRAKFGVRPADALQVAACLVQGAVAFVSNDRRLERLRSEIEILILDNWTSG